MSFGSDEKTGGVGKSRTMTEVSKEIRGAGADIKSEPAGDRRDPRAGDAPADKSKIAVPAPATDDAIVTNPKDVVVEPPAPTKKTPAEMSMDPKVLLNPDVSETGDPNAEGKIAAPGSQDLGAPGAPAAETANPDVVKEMGADEGLTGVLKASFEEFLKGKPKAPTLNVAPKLGV